MSIHVFTLLVEHTATMMAQPVTIHNLQSPVWRHLLAERVNYKLCTVPLEGDGTKAFTTNVGDDRERSLTARSVAVAPFGLLMRTIKP